MSKEKEGSVGLKNRLPHGSLKMITAAFGYASQANVSLVISGKKKGNTLLIECAQKIDEAYRSSGFQKDFKSILKKYKGKANKVKI
jgi:hypothetical protein